MGRGREVEIVAYLASVTVRSLGLAAAGWLCLALFGWKAPAERHAVWAVVTAGMLALAAMTALLPPVPVRVLPAAAPAALVAPLFDAPQAPRMGTGPGPAPLRSPTTSRFEWEQIAAAVYGAGAFILLLRLGYGYAFVRRLARASRPAGEVCESDWIVAPMTVGWLHPKILLPAGWVSWEPRKLEAVLAHERAHVRRADWAVAAIAAVNRCVFWFNPLTWWLERHLAALAEQACDDEAVLVTGAPKQYVQAMWDIAAAVRASGGRLRWEAVTMLRASGAGRRIERLLDEPRQIPRRLTPRRRVALAICGLAVVCLASVIEPARARVRQPAPAAASAGTIDYLRAKLPPEEVNRLERAVAEDPEDLAARTKLIIHYLVTGVNEPRARHVLWLIEHHPEAEVLREPLLFREPGPLQDVEAYSRATVLWRWQAALHPFDPRVILNAAHFFSIPGEDIYESEYWVKRALEIEPASQHWRLRLALLYSGSLLAAAGWQGYPSGWANPGFAQHARAELDNSTDGFLLWQAAQMLRLPPKWAKDNARFAALAEYGRRLQRRAEEGLGYRVPERVLRAPAARV